MNRNAALVLLLAATAAGGCGPNIGWIVKPIPLEEKLTETVVASDRGLFISDKIVLVDVDGLLLNLREEGLFGPRENPVSAFVAKLDKAQQDGNVRAVVLRINSPGGGVTASDMMYRRLVRFRAARRVPVVAVIEDVGASGAYYLACGADTIVAHPTSVTGSIGVLVQTLSLAGTFEKLGIEAKAVTSGPRKDMASPFKPLDKDDLAVLQTMVDAYYQQFLDVVAKARPDLDRDKLKALADGRVFTGEQAKANGLIDAVTYMDEAIALAKAASGAERVKVVMYHPPWGSKANVYSAAPVGGTQVNLLNVNVPDLLGLAQPQFLYLWTGHR